MMFRKLYWVAEDIDTAGAPHLRGVYTSIPNLIKFGFHPAPDLSRYRLTLTRLDSDSGIVAAWLGSEFSRLPADLRQYVETEDFSDDQARLLSEQVGQLVALQFHRTNA